MCCSYTYLNLDTAVNFEGKLQQLASCCITDSESLHCCCRLPNTFASCWTFSMPLCHTIGQEMPPLKKLPLSLGEIWAPTPCMVPWSRLSPYLKQHLDPYPNGWTGQGGVWVVDCERPKKPWSRPVYPVGRAVLGSHTRACPDLCAVDILHLVHLWEACFCLWLPFYYSNLLFLVLTISILISEECITDAAVWVLFLVTHVFSMLLLSLQ